MPHQSGYDLLCKVRQKEKTHNVPFTMLTGDSDKESIVNAIKAGVTDYIVKPFNTRVLIEKINKLFPQK